MILWILILLILIPIGFILWMPLRLVINSKEDLYKIEWQHLGQCKIIETEEGVGIYIEILFFKKIIPLTALFQRKTNDKSITKAQKPTPSKKGSHWVARIRKVLKAFEIKKCCVNWDTDDYLLNAYLYPVTPFLQSNHNSFIINFEGKREIEVIIESRLGRILKSIF